MLINNRYQIQKLLGRGGFGQTYLAFDTQCFDHPCVLKEFAPASRAEYAVQKARELFEREARTLYEIKHPQIPQFLAWFVDRGRLFLVQEYIAGKTYAQLLRERQQQGQAFSEAEILRWLTDLLPVLDYLHHRQIVHRDISPDNLMLPNQPKARPVLIDFGLVKQTLSQIYIQSAHPSSALEPASFVGKFGYAPPEQIRMGHCFPSSDLYALGVTTLVLLTGQEPRALMDQESLEWRWREYARVSDALAQVLDRLLQEKPKARYQTAREVLTALRTVTAPVPKFNLLAESSPPEFSTSGQQTIDLDPAFLQRCQQELTKRIGPIADFVLENTLAQHPHATPTQLIQALTLEIPDLAQAATFQTCLTDKLRTPFTPSPLPNRVAATPAQPHPTPASLSPDFLQHCQQTLTRCIGPVAGLILDDLITQYPQMTPQELIDAIMSEIPNSQQAQTFRKAMERQ